MKFTDFLNPYEIFVTLKALPEIVSDMFSSATNTTAPPALEFVSDLSNAVVLWEAPPTCPADGLLSNLNDTLSSDLTEFLESATNGTSVTTLGAGAAAVAGASLLTGVGLLYKKRQNQSASAPIIEEKKDAKDVIADEKVDDKADEQASEAKSEFDKNYEEYLALCFQLGTLSEDAVKVAQNLAPASKEVFLTLADEKLELFNILGNDIFADIQKMSAEDQREYFETLSNEDVEATNKPKNK